MANPYSRSIVWVGIGLLAAIITGFSYVLITDDGPPLVRQGVQIVRDIAFPVTDRPKPEATVAEVPPKPVAPTIVREPAPPAPADQPQPKPSAGRRAAQPADRINETDAKNRAKCSRWPQRRVKAIPLAAKRELLGDLPGHDAGRYPGEKSVL